MKRYFKIYTQAGDKSYWRYDPETKWWHTDHIVTTWKKSSGPWLRKDITGMFRQAEINKATVTELNEEEVFIALL